MYVCLCNRITDSEIRRHAGTAVRTPGAVYRAKGCLPRCGKCIPTVRSILQEAGTAGPAQEEALVAPAA